MNALTQQGRTRGAFIPKANASSIKVLTLNDYYLPRLHLYAEEMTAPSVNGI
jgi:hypothetical protein